MEAARAQSSLALQFVETIFEDLGYNLRYKPGYIDSVKSKNK
jgi:hypothetical protein